MSNKENVNDNQRYIEIDGEQIPVTEEVYRAYKRPLWAEHKRKERAKRCRDAKGRRCTEDCSTCPKAREVSVLSLDRFREEGGLEPADTFDMAEFVADRLLLEQLFSALNEEELALINALFYDERTERDYASELGISHQMVGKRKNKLIAKLQELAGVKK